MDRVVRTFFSLYVAGSLVYGCLGGNQPWTPFNSAEHGGKHWQLLTKDNFTSELMKHEHALCIAILPWCGESRSLMKSIMAMVKEDPDSFSDLQLFFEYTNRDRLLGRFILGSITPSITLFRHGSGYRYNGRYHVSSIMASIRHGMGVSLSDLPLKRITSPLELESLVKSTDTAVVLFEFCGWEHKLQQKQAMVITDDIASITDEEMPNNPDSEQTRDEEEVVEESENGQNILDNDSRGNDKTPDVEALSCRIPDGSHQSVESAEKSLYKDQLQSTTDNVNDSSGQSDKAYSVASDQCGAVENKEKRAVCRAQSVPHVIDGFFENTIQILDDEPSITDPIISRKAIEDGIEEGTKNIKCEKRNQPNHSQCTLEEYEHFEAVYHNLSKIAAVNVLTPQRAKFAVVTDEEIAGHVGVPSQSHAWLLMSQTHDFNNTSYYFYGEKDLEEFLYEHANPLVVELEDEGYKTLNDTPSVILFIDRMSVSPQVQEESKMALKTLRSVARHYASLDGRVEVETLRQKSEGKEKQAGGVDDEEAHVKQLKPANILEFNEFQTFVVPEEKANLAIVKLPQEMGDILEAVGKQREVSKEKINLAILTIEELLELGQGMKDSINQILTVPHGDPVLSSQGTDAQPQIPANVFQERSLNVQNSKTCSGEKTCLEKWSLDRKTDGNEVRRDVCDESKKCFAKKSAVIPLPQEQNTCHTRQISWWTGDAEYCDQIESFENEDQQECCMSNEALLKGIKAPTEQMTVAQTCAATDYDHLQILGSSKSQVHIERSKEGQERGTNSELLIGNNGVLTKNRELTLGITKKEVLLASIELQDNSAILQAPSSIITTVNAVSFQPSKSGSAGGNGYFLEIDLANKHKTDETRTRFGEAESESEEGWITLELYFVDGEHHMKEKLTMARATPSLVIVDPNKQAHHVFPTGVPINVSSLIKFLDSFVSGELRRTIVSQPPIQPPQEPPRPPFINRDFHEVNSIPRVTVDSFSILVTGLSQSDDGRNHYYPGQYAQENNDVHEGNLTDSAWDRDVLVLFTTPWCGFCKRMELVVREVYHSYELLKGLWDSPPREHSVDERKVLDSTRVNPSWSAGSGRIGESAACHKNSEIVANRNPVLLQMDCTFNDCSEHLGQISKEEIYPAVVLFPARKKYPPIMYDGAPTVRGIHDFLTAHTSVHHTIHINEGDTEKVKHSINKPKPCSISGSFHESNPAPSATAVKIGSSKEKMSSKRTTGFWEIESNFIKVGSHLEVGSVLLATDKLLGASPIFENSIVLIVNTLQDGVHGLILNKLMGWGNVGGLDTTVEKLLRPAALGYGGPLIEAHRPFLALTHLENLKGFVEVLPGVSYTFVPATGGLLEVIHSGRLAAKDFWFFLGYSYWTWDQLQDELSSEFWEAQSFTNDLLQWPAQWTN